MLAAGHIIDRYRLIRPLGAGAFGEVWLAEHVELAAQRALKIPTDPQYVKQLRMEGRIQFALNHPNIVQTFDMSTMTNPPHVVMEYIEGADLRKRLKAQGKLAAPEAMRIVSEILQALDAAHGQGVIHRDLKPENILLTTAGVVKVTDFGLGKAQAETARSLLLSGSMMSSTGTSIAGTVEYMSPEQKAGAPADVRDDLYAAGVIACELLTGARPSALGIARMFERAAVDKRLTGVVEKSLDDAASRYASARAMLFAWQTLAIGPSPAEWHGRPTRGGSGAAPVIQGGPPPLPPTTNQVTGVVRWEPTRMLVDCDVQVSLDGRVIGSASLSKGGQIPFSTTVGIHEFAVKIPIRRAKVYPVQFAEPGAYVITASYSRTWGNFEGRCAVSRG